LLFAPGVLGIYAGEFRQCAPAPLVRILTDVAAMSTVLLMLEYAQQTRQALRRYWGYSLAFFAAVMLLSLAGSFLLPRTYHSDARLFVRFGRTAVMDPTATATSGQVVSLYDTRESELNSLLEVLRSRSLLEQVVQTLGADNILEGRVKAELPVPPVKTPAVKQPVTIDDSTSREPRHQQALAKLEKSVFITVPRKTSTIIIGCKAERPELAQQVVATLVAAYMDEHLRVHHTPGSYEFFQEQTKLLEQHWKETSNKLREAKSAWNIVTIDGKRKLLEGQISDIEGKLMTNSGDLANAEAKIAALALTVGRSPEQVSPHMVDTPGQSVDGMRQELYKVESREQELASKFSDKHPQVLALRSTIGELKGILAEQALLNESSTATSLRGRAARLAEQHTQLAVELKELNTRDMQLGLLQREVDLAESRYKTYADKLEQARINDQLDKERISNITLVQPASFVAKSSGPRKIYVLGLGFVLAAFGSVGIALLAAILDPVLKRLADIEDTLRLPVLGAVRVGVA
jgi:polysaccharide biosynthesis protein PslE